MGIFEESRLLVVNVSNVCHAATVDTLWEVFVIQDGSVVSGMRQFSAGDVRTVTVQTCMREDLSASAACSVCLRLTSVTELWRSGPVSGGLLAPGTSTAGTETCATSRPPPARG